MDMCIGKGIDTRACRIYISVYIGYDMGISKVCHDFTYVHKDKNMNIDYKYIYSYMLVYYYIITTPLLSITTEFFSAFNIVLDA